MITQKITDLILQRPPMLMVDKLISCNKKKASTSFFIKETNIFCKNGKFAETGLIENMAQTAATRMGYLNHQSGKKVEKGFIAGISNLEIFGLPDVNSEIITEVFDQVETMGFTIIHGRVMAKDKNLAECELRVFIEQNN